MATDTKNNMEIKPCIRCSVGEVPLHKEQKKRQFVTSYETKEVAKKVPAHLLEMQQNFSERFTGVRAQNIAQQNNGSSANGNSNGANGTNNTNANANTSPPPQQNNEMNTLSQLAPIFNLLSGGKNPEIGNLIGALSSGNMDMNKMLNSMVQSQTAMKNNKTEAKPVNAKKENSNSSSQIKNLKRV